MKGKKGLDYIDWSISMGIFIIAIIALFVFLKPGARPEHKQDTLISIVEQKFLDRTQWFVHETPLFVKKFQDKGVNNQQAIIDVKATGDIRFTAVNPSTDYRYDSITRTGAKVTLNCHTSCDNTNFTLIGITKQPQETIDMEADCSSHPNEQNTCMIILGATVTHHGLQQSEINNLKTADYTALKNTWTYPLQKEFALYQDGTKVIGGQEPATQANVFVKEVKLNLISDQGAQTPTTISIRVW